jgi:hypothetical protein
VSTFNELTDRIIDVLQTHTADQDEQTYLTQSITDSSLTFTVDEPRLISQGIVEIDEELLWAKSIDNLSKVVTISPFGRGYKSTTAVAHSENSRIVSSPVVTRSAVKKAIQRVIDGVYPDLYIVKTTKFNYVASRVTYELPADCEQIQSVTAKSIGPSRMWPPIRKWDFIPTADVDAFPTGKAIDLYQVPVPGMPVLVTYIASPSNLSDGSDDFETTTGLSAAAEQAVMYGACAQLIAHMGSARLNIQTIEATLRSSVVPNDAAYQLSTYYFGMYEMFVQQEREKLLRLYPTTSHYRYV